MAKHKREQYKQSTALRFDFSSTLLLDWLFAFMLACLHICFFSCVLDYLPFCLSGCLRACLFIFLPSLSTCLLASLIDLLLAIKEVFTFKLYI